MREPPPGLADDVVLTIVRRHWPFADVDGIEHLPAGFGAHHWKASVRDEPRLFVTLDPVGGRHTAASLAAYAAAAALELDDGTAGRPDPTANRPGRRSRRGCRRSRTGPPAITSWPREPGPGTAGA